MEQTIRIQEINESEVASVISYIKEFRKDLFPMLDHTKVPKDLSHFNENYLRNPLGCFLEAVDNQAKRIGVIGMSEYDHRFEYLNYEGSKTVEVARLYVEPAYRRNGIASRLVDELYTIAETKGIEQLYLHTHPFLPGAVKFWLSKGFEQTIIKQECGFTTIHMDKKIKTTL